MPVGIEKDNSIQIPDDISKVGWYKHGAAPGSKGGSVVIVGHRDSDDPEPGAFYFLNNLMINDSIIINYSNYTLSYKVKKIKIINKNQFYKISKDVFSLTGRPRLALISCFGPYKKNIGYENNIVVIADMLT